MNQQPRAIDPSRQLVMQLAAAKNMLSHLRDVAAGDEDFLADMVEGETGLFEIIARIDRSELDDRILIDGINTTIEALQARKEKAEQRAETKRALIAAALSEIGLRTHRTPLGTITVSEKTPIAIVTEEADIPTRFWTSQAPKLDKASLNKALRDRAMALEAAGAIDGEEERRAALKAANEAFPAIPGATLSNGGIKLSIRR